MASSIAFNQLSRIFVKSARALVLAPVKVISNNRILTNIEPISTKTFFLSSKIHTRPEQAVKSTEEEEDKIALHQEVMERWRQEEANLRAIMVMDDVTSNVNNPSEVASDRSHQVKALFEELIEDGLLDPRLLWTTSARD